MKSIFFFLLIACTVIYSCSSNAGKSDKKSYEETKESLAGKEKKNPLSFLEVKGDDKKNIIGQTVVRGNIKNKASIVSYKNVRVKMLCYKEGKMVEEHEDVIKDAVKPSSEKDFVTRYRLPKGTDSIALSIMSAEVE